MREEPGRLSSAIHALSKEIGRPLKLMEVCGTHTVAIFRHGVRSLLPEGIRLLSGPGCPVCVTSIHDVDTAAALAKTPGVVLATFGDMMRVPGGEASLNDARADGADVRVVYSPLDALTLAAENPQMQVVFFATGFETTSPLVAGTLMEADARGVKNFSIYPSHKLVPPALRALLSSGEVEIDGFILPGHVCTISGREPYDFVASEFGTPGVITGFDAADILEGILMLLTRVRSGEPAVEIQYRKVVREEGNPRAREVTGRCLRPTDAYWRGIGTIPESGLTGGGAPRAEGVLVRRGAEGREDTHRVPALRNGVHAGAARGGLHGEHGGKLCGLLPVRGRALKPVGLFSSLRRLT
jgi:hydrogenase expression/formation protein HypD